MKHILENMTRRPVTFMGNSGKYYHLPPRYKLEIAAHELSDNAFVDKLALRHVLAVHVTAGARKAEDAAEKPDAKDAGKKDKRPK